MDKEKAIRAINSVFSKYKKIRKADSTNLKELTDGKLYELFVLGQVLRQLRARGFRIKFIGTTLEFKAAPGFIDANDPHFEIFSPGASAPDFKLYTDIEFRTLGSSMSNDPGASSYHELDIVIVRAEATGRPRFDQVALGVECKSTAKFKKSILKEVLGVRRELSLLSDDQLSALSRFEDVETKQVPADPPSEFWLAHIDPSGSLYESSPRMFGIQFQNWTP